MCFTHLKKYGGIPEDTSIIWSFDQVPMVSRLEGLHCTWFVNFSAGLTCSEVLVYFELLSVYMYLVWPYNKHSC